MSPFKSKAQRSKFYALKEEGKMDQATIDRWESETPKGKKLPARVGPKKPRITSVKQLRKIAAKKT